MKNKADLLIVDDSLVFRRGVETALQDEPKVNIVGSVRNGEKAIEFIKKNPPDIVTLDVEMPGMDGLETLEKIQTFNRSGTTPPIGVIMLSAFTKRGADVTLEALEKGAFDFIPKPNNNSQQESIESLRRQLTTKINVWLTGRKKTTLSDYRTLPTRKVSAPRTSDISGVDVILIGVSTGGPKALNQMLPLLCSKINQPILIVQHMPPTFTKSLAEQLNSKCRNYTVAEAKEDDIVEDNRIYIAPGGQHMLVKKSVTQYYLHVNSQPPENGCRPSVDVLFRSASQCYRDRALTIILTGMGTDGTKGIVPLKRAGAYVIAQDQESSVVWGMPGSAVASGNVDEVNPLMEIPGAVEKIIKRN